MCYCFISVLKQNNQTCQKMQCPYQHISKDNRLCHVSSLNDRRQESVLTKENQS